MPTPPHEFAKAAIGQRLTLTRQALGLNQTVFAERAGILRTAYTQYESGEKRPSIQSAIALCDTYDLTLDWIYRGDLSGVRYEIAATIAAMRAARV